MFAGQIVILTLVSLILIVQRVSIETKLFSISLETMRKTTAIKAWWNYEHFEAGHGKGPCHCLGSLTKRFADEAMKTGKVIIQDAKDFFAWTELSSCTMHNVKFRIIPKEKSEYTGKAQKTIKGTMKIHAVVGQGSNSDLVRNVSCYCGVCLYGGHCKLWSYETTIFIW